MLPGGMGNMGRVETVPKTGGVGIDGMEWLIGICETVFRRLNAMMTRYVRIVMKKYVVNHCSEKKGALSRNGSAYEAMLVAMEFQFGWKQASVRSDERSRSILRRTHA